MTTVAMLRIGNKGNRTHRVTGKDRKVTGVAKGRSSFLGIVGENC